MSTLSVWQDLQAAEGGRISELQAGSEAKQAAQANNQSFEPHIGAFVAQLVAQPLPQAPAQTAAPASSDQSDDRAKGTWTKRILGIIPNFQAVSVDTYLASTLGETEVLDRDPKQFRLLRIYICRDTVGGGTGHKHLSRVSPGSGRLRPLLLAYLCGPSRRKLHCGSNFPVDYARRFALLHFEPRGILAPRELCV